MLFLQLVTPSVAMIASSYSLSNLYYYELLAIVLFITDKLHQMGTRKHREAIETNDFTASESCTFFTKSQLVEFS